MGETAELKVEQQVNIQNNIEESIGPWAMVWKRFVSNKIAMFGLILLTILLLLTIFGPMFSAYGIDEMQYDSVNEAPTVYHLLGTDELGRDYLTRIFAGGRVSMMVAIVSSIISIVLGSLVGASSGYYGGWVDNLLQRFVEIWSSIPFLPVVITISAIIGEKVSGNAKVVFLTILIGCFGWTGLARLVRGQVLSLREQEFMQAATALGIRDSKKIIKHLLPNVYGIIIVSATLGVADAILTEAALSFLGLGVTPPTPSWGNLVSYCREYYVLQNRLWLWIPPGLMIFLTVMSINLVGDGLRSAVNPKGKA